MPIVCLGLNHRTAPVEVRERFAIADKALPDVLARLRSETGAQEAVVLSTCNRVEVYAWAPGESAPLLAALRRFMLAGGTPPATEVFYALAEPASVQHLFRVAGGLDSMILGETEILGQLKAAYDIALQNRSTGACLNKAFQRAFNAAKLIRTETNIQRGSVSVASVAVELAEKIFESLSGRTVMVIGAGDTGEKTARALLSRGAQSVLVSNRTPERAEALARELGGRAIAFEAWEQEFAQIDIVISSTSAPHHVLDRKKLEPLQHLRHHRPLLLIDIAVPRDIEPEVNYMEDVYLYNIDDLQAIADDCLRLRQEEVAKCEAIIAHKTRDLLDPSRSGPLGDSQPAFGSQ